MNSMLDIEGIDIHYAGAAHAIAAHKAAGHLYDEYLPYDFHLRLAAKIAQDFSYLLPKDLNIQWDIYSAVWNHDVMEDARKTYNDIKKVLGVRVADIVYAVTNEKGKTRKERANNKYYEGIRNTEYAVFVKLCDRLANVRYGLLTGGKMVAMYRKEQDDFEDQLGLNEEEPYWPMVQQLRRDLTI